MVLLLSARRTVNNKWENTLLQLELTVETIVASDFNINQPLEIIRPKQNRQAYERMPILSIAFNLIIIRKAHTSTP